MKAPDPAGGWRFAADRGGTFTDIVAIDPAGRLHTRKLLSVSPDYPDAVAAGVRALLDLPPHAQVPAGRVASLRVGTTVATNALLEGRGARVGLLVTRGFRDLLRIGRQARPRLFDLAVQLPRQLYGRVAEVGGRLDADGTEREPLDETAAAQALADWRAQGVEAVAIVLLHAWRNPAHERRLAALARAAGFAQVSVSHRCGGRIRMVERGQTCVLDAYLSPVLAAYLDRLTGELGELPVEFMQSGGGLAPAALCSGKDAVLSGPAGGVVAVAGLARRRGRQPLIGFDMGGTSTDVCRYDGQFDYTAQIEAAGVAFQSHALRVQTVAAGGGSILGFDGQRLTVGPASAGADPGPACYGRGGPLTLTDANLLLGRLPQAAFSPHPGRGPAGLDVDATRRAFVALAQEVSSATGRAVDAETLALGYVAVANEQMAAPIKTLSVGRGFDLREHALCCYGGAGGLHACAMARDLGIEDVLIHPLAGVFSAWGIAQADRLEQAERSVLLALGADTLAELEPLWQALEADAGSRLQGAADRVERELDLRPRGGDAVLTVALDTVAAMIAAYGEAHTQRFGYAPAGDTLEVVNLRLRLRRAAALDDTLTPSAEPTRCADAPARRVVLHDGPAELPCHRREALAGGAVLAGPCLIVAAHYTVLVEADFDARLLDDGVLQLRRRQDTAGSATGPVADVAQRDPVRLELYNRRFMGVAQQMGAVLQHTAHSVNMTERLDYSCAVFDAAGRLVANAPHVPVHLGAMGEAVRALIASHGDRLAPGQVYLDNHPGHGGSHLPDVTAISPVFVPDAAGAVLFVATRGHHADIGGVTPGSMSPLSRTLDEEGVVLDRLLAVDGGRLREADLRAALGAGPHPARNLAERLSDLAAQIAANRHGSAALQALVAQHGLAEVRAYAEHVQANAAHCIGQALAAFGDFEGRFEDALDDGTPVAVRLRIGSDPQRPDGGRLQVDFSGSGDRHPGAFNAPRAVVQAALLYVLRCLVSDDIPLNEGCLRPVTLHIPPGSLLDPPPDAAVAAGNVETSQRVVDVLLGALGLAAASQGTMNNVLFGFADAQYYETLGGGSGATAGHDGAAGVQVHMTNTRITDPEVLEHRLPGLRLRRFALRRGSGGDGRRRGGDGLLREYELLAPATLTLITQRRQRAPFGLAGGAPGAVGRNRLWRNGRWQTLAPVGVWSLQAGDVLCIETPGGGGYGAPAG